MAGQPGYRSRLNYSDADYFRLSDNDTRIAKAARQRPAPTLEQIMYVLASMPVGTDIERRNRALVAFTISMGARDGALASMRLKHVDLVQGKVVEDAREVRTKFSKTFTTWFFPVGPEPLAIVTDWVEHLRGELLWGGDDPLFPRTRVGLSESRTFRATGLERVFWSNAQPIRAGSGLWTRGS